MTFQKGKTLDAQELQHPIIIFLITGMYGTTSDIATAQHINHYTMSIKIQVAVCTKCNGYCSSAPLDKKDIQHPDIVDHFFYHGEPRFTLDQETFEKVKKYEHTEIVIVDLRKHEENDHLQCNCAKQVRADIPKYRKAVQAAERYETDEIYFKDLYYTYNNFHGISPAASYTASNRKYG